MSRKKEAETDDVTRALPHACGPEKSVLSSILQQPETFIRLALNENVVEDDFYLPAHRILYGFLLKLHSNDEPIELVSLVQHLIDNGLLDRIGGPSALTDLYTYATSSCHFSLHLGQVKDKAVLREIIQRANTQIAAAYDAPEEVKELVEQCATDAAEIKTKTENRSSNFRKYREQLISPEEMEQETKDYFGGNTLLDGDACFLPDFALGFRKHEFSVWLGVSNHGKSQALQNQLAYLAARGRKSLIASLEQKSSVTMAQILKCMTGYPDLHKTEEWTDAYRYITSMVQMYKGNERTCPKHLVETFRQAYLNDGTDTFGLDNLMMLNTDRGDNSALASTMDRLRNFFSDYPVHGHLIVHPRKTADENVGKPATQNSIRGPAEIGDMPQTVIVVHRDMAKTDRIEEMKAGGMNQSEIDAFWHATPCGKIIVRKQRATGAMPVCDVWFSPEANQFMPRPGKPKPFFDGQPPWYPLPSA